MAAKIKPAKTLQRPRAGMEDADPANAWHDVSVAAKSTVAKKSISGAALRSLEKQISELRCRLAESDGLTLLRQLSGPGSERMPLQPRRKIRD